MEEEMATHSSMLACKIPQTEMPGGLQSMGSKESDTTERLSMHTSLLMKGKNISRNEKVWCHPYKEPSQQTNKIYIKYYEWKTWKTSAKV